MDLEPFGRINPCGLFGIEVVDMAREADKSIEVEQVKPELVAAIVRHFGLIVS
jgi:lipoate-protein ligase B